MNVVKRKDEKIKKSRSFFFFLVGILALGNIKSCNFKAGNKKFNAPARKVMINLISAFYFKT